MNITRVTPELVFENTTDEEFAIAKAMQLIICVPFNALNLPFL